MSTRRCPALLVSAPASHVGKTAVTAALARVYRNRGLNVRVFKTGPDFLDAMLLERASGNPVYQLDLWMMGESYCRRRLYEAAATADVILVEGVLGLHDGNPSTADLAATFSLPIALVLNVAGMAQSAHAVAYGLATYRDDLDVVGLVANNVGSARHIEMLCNSQRSSLPILATIERRCDAEIPSRHLGLVQADELDTLQATLQTWSEMLDGSVLATLPPPVSFEQDGADHHASGVQSSPASLTGVRIGVAKDRAFSFIYKANIEWLEQQGAHVSYFSPLADASLPNVDTIYLPGGYPELHLDALSDNRSMIESIRQFHGQGKRIYAECGGMLYLLRRLTDAGGNGREMVGLIDASAEMQRRLCALGYQYIDARGERARGHTFHYSRLIAEQMPSEHATKQTSGERGEPIFIDGSLFASYLHLHFESAPNMVAGLCSNNERASAVLRSV